MINSKIGNGILDKKIPKLNNLDDKEIDKHMDLIQAIAGKEYVMDYANRKAVIKGMILYFNNDKRCCKFGFDLKKGIALTGKNGVGKTLLFEIFQEYNRMIFSKTFRITSNEDIIHKWNNDNNELYTFNNSKPVNLVINEFEYISNQKHYGFSVADYFNQFYMIRYELFEKGIKTHVTTNHDFNHIKKHYPEKLISRFNQMFKFIELKGDSFRV